MSSSIFLPNLILFPLTSLLIVGGRIQGAQLYNAPTAVISEYYGNPYYENTRPVRIPRNSEVIVGETTSQGISKLLFECTASYPVQWIYTGDGIPEIATDTKRQQNTLPPGEFFASLSIARLTESHTGNYTCRGTTNRNAFVSFHLYVPGNTIFISNGGENLTFTNNDRVMRIPCSVSHPQARVSLQKSRNGMVSCPLNDSLTFNPKIGFLLRVKELYDPSGHYVCIGSYQNMYKMIHFQLNSKYEPTRFSACDPNPCGRNAECFVTRGRVVCSCIAGFEGDPFNECRGTIQRGSDPCYPSPCGRYGDCVVRNGLAACTCSPGYQGKPPHCTRMKPSNSRCVIHQDCNSLEMCLERVCTNPCGDHGNTNRRNSRCGRGAECQVINRTPICSCPTGTYGDPNRECIPEPFNSNGPPYEEELEERLRPECQYDDECPSNMGCIHQRCQNPCPSACGGGRSAFNCQVVGHKAVCNHLNINCAPGDINCRLFGGPPKGIGGCHRMSCGPNSDCQDMNGQGICSCLPGFTGSPPDCSPICFGNSGCPKHQACQARKCQDPCGGQICGINGKCAVKNHKAECQCLNGYIGDPNSRCTLVPSTLLQPLCNLRCGRGARCQYVNRTATCRCIDPYDPHCGQIEGKSQNCFNDQDCSGLQGCFNGLCRNPCVVFQGLCGINQECVVRDHKAECTCLPGFPFRVNNDCFRDTRVDPPMRRFDPVVDDEENVGQCQPPYCRRGNPLEENNRCHFVGDCPSTKKCVNSHCVDFCDGTFCGINAECRVERISRVSRCYCPPGYLGSPKIQCYPLFRPAMQQGVESDKDIVVLSQGNSTDAVLTTTTEGSKTGDVGSSSIAGGNEAKKLIQAFKKKNSGLKDNSTILA